MPENIILAYINTDPFLLFFGGFYMVLGFSFFLAKSAWQDFMTLFAENDALSLVMGILVLPISLFIIVFYNDWEGASSIVLMVLGYMGFAKALTLLLWPSLFQNLARQPMFARPFWLYGIFAIAIGTALIVL